MLKIKDDVDLKELEKFGFKKIIFGINEFYLKSMYRVGTGICVNVKNRDIYFNDYAEELDLKSGVIQYLI